MRQVDGSARPTGPVEGQPGIIMAGFDLGQVGYTLAWAAASGRCLGPLRRWPPLAWAATMDH